MKFLRTFMHQQAPKAGTDMPPYFVGALITGERLLALYLALFFFFIAGATLHWEFLPAVLLVVLLLYIPNVGQIGPRVNLGFYTAMLLTWCGWYVHILGWSHGVQHFLASLLVVEFFNVFDPPWAKIGFFAGLLAFHLALFYYSLNHAPVYELNSRLDTAFQVINSAFLFLLLAVDCIHFSTSIQDAERQLRIDNQALTLEAGTDPLTQLPNRRALMDVIDEFLRDNPGEPYCLAIADIDFFKRINDTYGHACGDYTLRKLADRFKQSAGTEYRVCRWGGEEFCFFLPEKNLDEAGQKMMDLNLDVARMPLSFEGTEYSITITIGVGEFDFRSPVEAIIEEADRKLYMGKEAGRDRVIV